MALKRMDSLRDKLEERALVAAGLAKIDDKIDEIVGDKKVKIKRKASKKGK